MKIVISLTSYPKRIHCVPAVIESLLRQTRRADKIVLWLAEEQFCEREQELPVALLKYISEGIIELYWCNNLKPHTKYFYSLQKYTEDVVITVDDDIVYPEYLIEKLYESYIKYPFAVSAGRVHYIPVIRGKMLPYMFWPKETDALIGNPSDYLLATGVGGVLYPPHLFDKMFFDRDVIENTCLNADDLWLKLMELHCNVPVVLAMENIKLEYVAGSQEVSLYRSNGRGGQNDVQLKNIIRWYDQLFGDGACLGLLSRNNRRSVLAELSDYCDHLKAFLCRKYL